MVVVAEKVLELLGGGKIIKMIDRVCNFANYYGIPATTKYHNISIPADAGPLAHGMRNRGCPDCMSCKTYLQQCPKSAEIEYLQVDFAKDVEYQTEEYEFTQENVFLGYLKKMKVPPSYPLYSTAGYPDNFDNLPYHDEPSTPRNWTMMRHNPQLTTISYPPLIPYCNISPKF